VSGVSEKTIKLLFGSASSCAFPGCAERLIDRINGKLIVVAEIAHIRSEKPNGPRYDPSYDEPNGFDNLLLACAKHHKLIDDYPADHPVSLLEGWKADQTTQIGARLSSEDVAEVVAHFLSPALEALTTVSLDVAVVGGLKLGDTMMTMPVAVTGRISVGDPEAEKFVGVSVSNIGWVDVEIANAGLDLDFAYDFDQLVFSPWTFPPDVNGSDPYPYRLLRQSGGKWFQPLPTVSATVQTMIARLHVLQRLRGFAITGSGIRIEGEWVPAIDLPIWRDGFTANDLAAMQEKARQARTRSRE
jgi:hypothetical protein